MSAGEAFSWCYASPLPFLGSGVELVPFNPPHVGPGRFLGGLKRGDCMLCVRTGGASCQTPVMSGDRASDVRGGNEGVVEGRVDQFGVVGGAPA